MEYHLTRKMQSLFTPAQMTELVTDRRKIRAEKEAERLKPFVDTAVKFYACEMRPNSQRIIDDLKYSNWSFAFEFKSFDFHNIEGFGHRRSRFGCAMRRSLADDAVLLNNFVSHYDVIKFVCPIGTVIDHGHGLHHQMWRIYSSTDFRQRLLAELGLDPLHFDFKNLSEIVSADERLFKDDEIIEYRNKVHLVYTERPTKKSLNPIADAWAQHVDLMQPLEEI